MDVMNMLAAKVAADKHERIHFSQCYDDYCLIHLSSKRESGEFPQKPTKPKKSRRKVEKRLTCQEFLEAAKAAYEEDLAAASRTLVVTNTFDTDPEVHAEAKEADVYW